MNIHYLFNSTEQKLHVRPDDKACPHQLTGTEHDNLIEYAGRICYDSLGSEKTRSSVDYHQHINDVGHTSVQEHSWHTFKSYIGGFNPQGLLSMFLMLGGRKGVEISVFDEFLLCSMNARCLNEFTQARCWLKKDFDKTKIHQMFLSQLAKRIPVSLRHHFDNIDLSQLTINKNLQLINDESLPPEHTFVSYVVSGVSRGLTHELIRHRSISPSQRSTRYVDESKNDWAWHPLLTMADNSAQFTQTSGLALLTHRDLSQQLYSKIVTDLEKEQISKGVDKFTARKQARGAARGVLGNALATELVITDSLANWRNVFIKQRMTEGADAEICQLANLIHNDLVERRLIAPYAVKPHPMGCLEGYHVIV